MRRAQQLDFLLAKSYHMGIEWQIFYNCCLYLPLENCSIPSLHCYSKIKVGRKGLTGNLKKCVQGLFRAGELEQELEPESEPEPELEPAGARCFWLLEAGAGAAEKKKEAGAVAAWKKSQEPKLELLKN